MDDLIRRQNAVRWVKTNCNPYGKPTLDYDSGIKVINHLEKMTPADAVEVVRCGDCKHMSPVGVCTYFADSSVRPSASDFCSYGERKDDG